MKTDSKSATIRKVAGLFALLGWLAGCSGDPLPNWLTGEPGPEIYNEPRVVRVPDHTKDGPWPNLADVPEAKPTYLPEAKIDGLTRALVQDKAEAQSEAARIGQIDLGPEAAGLVAKAPAAPAVQHMKNDPVVQMEGELYPVGLLTAPDQPETTGQTPQIAPPVNNSFSALRP